MHQLQLRHTSRATRITLMLFLLTLTVLYLQYSHVLHCEMIRFSSFIRIDSNVYVSKSIPEEEHELIGEMLDAARHRIASFWNEKRGNAKVIICDRAEEYEKYCHSREGAGCSLGTIYGTSFIVLNRHGLNTDVIAHEMCHNELFERLGWKKTTFEIPQWFNEGLSMMLDYRFVNAKDSVMRYRRYLQEWKLRTVPPAKRLTLAEISTLKGFFDGDARHVSLAYITAATEVSYWLMNVGHSGLTGWMAKMENGAEFDSYYEMEKEILTQSGVLPSDNPVRQLEKLRPDG